MKNPATGATPGLSGGSAAADLKAWRAKKGAKTINAQIATLNAQLPRITTLAGAKGLSAAVHAKYADAEASDKKELKALGAELTVMRGWRNTLASSDSSLSSWITAAGDTKILAKNVAEWKKQLAAQKATIGEISVMLGPAGGGGGSGPSAAATSKAGAAYLKAYKASGGTINSRITKMTTQLGKDTTLASAKGLSAKLRAQYVKSEASDKKSLAALNTELTVMRAYRTQLSGSDASLSSWISAAGSTPALAKNVTAWKAQLADQQKTVNQISAMLGPTAAQAAAAASSAAASTASSGLSSSAGSSASSSAGSTASSAPGVTISPEQALQLLNLASSVGGAPSGMMPGSGLPAPVPGAAAWFDNGEA